MLKNEGKSMSKYLCILFRLQMLFFILLHPSFSDRFGSSALEASNGLYERQLADWLHGCHSKRVCNFYFIVASTLKAVGAFKSRFLTNVFGFASSREF